MHAASSCAGSTWLMAAHAPRPSRTSSSSTLGPVESGDPPRRTRSASSTTSCRARRAGSWRPSDHAPGGSLRVDRGCGEARQDTGGRPRSAGRRGGAPVSHGTQRRRRRGNDNDQGRTVNQIPKGVDGISNTVCPWVTGSRWGSSTCGPDHARFAQAGTRSSS
jgi:hypothetical protein